MQLCHYNLILLNKWPFDWPTHYWCQPIIQFFPCIIEFSSDGLSNLRILMSNQVGFLSLNLHIDYFSLCFYICSLNFSLNRVGARCDYPCLVGARSSTVGAIFTLLLRQGECRKCAVSLMSIEGWCLLTSRRFTSTTFPTNTFSQWKFSFHDV